MKKTGKNLFRLLGLGLLGLTLASCGKNSPAPTSPASGGGPSYSFSGDLGISGSNPMNGPEGIAISGDNLWVANQDSSSLQAWSLLSESVLLTITSYPSYSFAFPTGVTVGPDGFVYVVDANHEQIVEFTPTGAYAGVFGTADISTYSQGIVVDATDAYVVDNNVLRHFSISGTGNAKTLTFQGNEGTTGAGALNNYATGAALDGSNNVYVADFNNQRIVKYSPAGVFQQAVTLSHGVPIGVAVDPSGNIFTSALGEIQVYSPSGGFLTSFGKGIVQEPWFLAFDSNSNLYVADNGPNLGYTANWVDVFKKN